MGLRRQILSRPEVLADLVAAADRRFGDAESLLRANRFSGAVYFLGLCSEMWLKCAGFRVAGARLTSPVDGFLMPAGRLMSQVAPAVNREGFHSLLFWVEYLLHIRRACGNPMSAAGVGELRHHVCHRLFEDWKIELRYRAAEVSRQQAQRVYNDAAWLRLNWNRLWRE